MNHNDYVFSISGDGVATFHRRFEEMYQNCSDPHGQSAELQRTDYQIVLGVVAKALQSRSDAEHNRILDVGCGLGFFTARLGEFFPSAEVTGCDISATAVKKAAAAAPNCAFFTVDLKDRQTLPDRAYDVLVALHVLPYFTNDEIAAVIDNLNRLLVPGGFLLVGHHLPKKMTFGRFIGSLDDANTLFAEHGFTMRIGIDITNDLDVTYSGEPVGRNLYFLAQKTAA